MVLTKDISSAALLPSSSHAATCPPAPSTGPAVSVYDRSPAAEWPVESDVSSASEVIRVVRRMKIDGTAPRQAELSGVLSREVEAHGHVGGVAGRFLEGLRELREVVRALDGGIGTGKRKLPVFVAQTGLLRRAYFSDAPE